MIPTWGRRRRSAALAMAAAATRPRAPFGTDWSTIVQPSVFAGQLARTGPDAARETVRLPPSTVIGGAGGRPARVAGTAPAPPPPGGGPRSARGRAPRRSLRSPAPQPPLPGRRREHWGEH